MVEETGAGKFQVQVSVHGTRFVADEPADVGGLGSGPSPYELVAAGLGACTAMTLRLYADRKGWPLHRTRVAVRHDKIARPDPAGRVRPQDRARGPARRRADRQAVRDRRQMPGAPDAGRRLEGDHRAPARASARPTPPRRREADEHFVQMDDDVPQGRRAGLSHRSLG